jgi:uncharacterized membrane protein (UPF0127 family)
MDAAPHSSAARFTLVVAVVIVGVFAVVAFRHRSFDDGTVRVGDVAVKVAVAATAETRERGLSGKEALDPKEGMLFVFDRPDLYGFWMKDMRFPIDILWIRDGEVADITPAAPVPEQGGPLPVFSPRIPVDSVLEVRAGFAADHGIGIGSPVTFELARDKKRLNGN